MTRNPLDIDSVRRCHKCATLGQDHVPSEGNPEADLMIVGRDPGGTEVELGRPFIGPCGEIIDYVLDEAGVDRMDIYVANAVKCHTPKNRGPHFEELATCARTWLYDEIRTVNPKVLVILGRDCHSAIMGAEPFKHLGTVKGKNRVAVMAWHPGYVLRQAQLQPEYISGLGATIKQCLDETGGRDG